MSELKKYYKVTDGIYEVIVTNISRDCETGYVDDWDLELVPFVEG